MRICRFTTASQPKPRWALIDGEILIVLTEAPFAGLRAGKGRVPPEMEMWSPQAGGNPFITHISTPGNLKELSVGFFDDDCGEKYVMVQNVNHPGASFPLGNNNSLTIDVDFDFTNVSEPGFDKTVVQYLDKVTGQIETMPLQAQGSQNLKRLSVTLPAAEVFFFKYKTQRPFAVQPR